MSSPSFGYHTGSFTGAAALITIATCPFPPKSVRFIGTSDATGLKTDKMPGDEYVSNSGADTGVTLTNTGFTVASGADVNATGETVYYECLG